MILELLLSMAATEQSQHSISKQGIAVGERFAAAIKSEAEFHEADFGKALSEGDKATLRKFGGCKVKHIDHPATADPREPNVYVRNLGQVSVGLNCKGVPWDTPVGISLHLQDGKVSKIETHNADLMRAN